MNRDEPEQLSNLKKKENILLNKMNSYSSIIGKANTYWSDKINNDGTIFCGCDRDNDNMDIDQDNDDGQNIQQKSVLTNPIKSISNPIHTAITIIVQDNDIKGNNYYIKT